MFQLAEMRDMVRVPPAKFHLPLEQAIGEELNRKLSNKVFLNVGVGVCLFDLKTMETSYILPGDGSSHTRTTFRYVVFRPCLEEVIQGVVKASSPLGLQVSIDFFDGIFIKDENMMAGSYYDETEKIWVWKYEDEQNEQKLFMDVGSKILFRVVSEEFVDTTPSGPELAEEEFRAAQEGSNAPASSAAPQVPPPAPDKDPFSEKHPYTILGSIDGSGLGMTSWWDEEDAAEDAAEDTATDDADCRKSC